MSELTHDDLQHAAEIAGDDGCFFCALWFRDITHESRPPLPKHDFIREASIGNIIDRCPGCFIKIEGRREHVENLVGVHRKMCADFAHWEKEQRLRVELGKLT